MFIIMFIFIIIIIIMMFIMFNMITFIIIFIFIFIFIIIIIIIIFITNIFILIISPFWTGQIDLSLSSTDQLTISGLISASSGTYNPRYPIYDSRTAMVLYLPRGVYVELAELALMQQSGKIPDYISYQEFVDTDACFEEAGAQLLVFIAEATIYPLYVVNNHVCDWLID